MDNIVSIIEALLNLQFFVASFYIITLLLLNVIRIYFAINLTANLYLFYLFFSSIECINTIFLLFSQ